MALEKLELEIHALECKRNILLPAGGGEVGTGDQEGLVYQRKSRVQLKGRGEGKVKGQAIVVFCLESDTVE